MTTTGVFLPDESEQQPRKKPPQSVRTSGDETEKAEPAQPDAEIRKLNEEELKAAIVSAWRKVERFGKKEMGGLLYWLREKLRAQGSRNDLREQDKGFGAWVEKTIRISRRTADRWANDYGYEQGLIKRKPKSTSGQDDQMLFSTEDDDFLEGKRRKHGRQIQVNYWATVAQYRRHERAVKILKKYFKTTSTQEAIVQGVQYAAGVIHRAGSSKVQVVSRAKAKVGHKQMVSSANRHRTRRSPEASGATARPKAFHATAG
jgi:hypothetical protein